MVTLKSNKITKALMIAFLINGGFALAENNPITPGTNLGGENATAIGAGSVAAGSEASSVGNNTFASGNNMTKEEYLKFLKDNKERLSKIEAKMQEIKNDKDEIEKLRQEHDDIINKIDRINNYKKTIEEKEKELNEKEPQILKTIEEKRTEAIKFTKEIDDLNKRIDIINQLDFSKINEENKAQGVEILAKDLKQKMEDGQTWLKQYGENGIPLEEYKNAVLNYIDKEKKDNIKNRIDEIINNSGSYSDGYIRMYSDNPSSSYTKEYDKKFYIAQYKNIKELIEIHRDPHSEYNIGRFIDGNIYIYDMDSYEIQNIYKLTKSSLDHITTTNYLDYLMDNYLGNDSDYLKLLQDETLPIPEKYNTKTIEIARKYVKETQELRDNIDKIKKSNTTDEVELLKLKKYKSELEKINKKYEKISPIINSMLNFDTIVNNTMNISDIYSDKYIDDLISKIENSFPKKVANSDELPELLKKYNQELPNSNLTKVYQDEIDRLKKLEQDANTFITEKEELIKGYKNDIENLKQLLNSEHPSDVEEVNKQIQEKEEKIKKALSDIENLKKNLTEIKPGSNALAYGTNSAALGKDSIAFGTNNIAIKESSIAFGTNNFVNGDKSIALGYGHKIIGDKSVALGDPNLIYGDNNFAIGNNIKIGTETQKVNNNHVLFIQVECNSSTCINKTCIKYQ